MSGRLNSISAGYEDPRPLVRQWLTDELDLNVDHLQDGDLCSPQQANMSDCGFWTVLNAVAYINNKTAAASQWTTEDMRLWLLRTLSDALFKVNDPYAPNRNVGPLPNN